MCADVLALAFAGMPAELDAARCHDLLENVYVPMCSCIGLHENK